MFRRRLALAGALSLLAGILGLVAAPTAAPAQEAGPIVALSGVVDGPLPGGLPKVVEITAAADVADTSVIGIGVANNGNPSDGVEFTLPSGSLAAGQSLCLATETTGFAEFFGFAPDATTGVLSINGDDAIELFVDGALVDTYGEVGVDGTGQVWDHLDGWAKRTAGTGPDGSFVADNWTFSGPNALDNETTNDTATSPFPISCGDGGGGDDGGDPTPVCDPPDEDLTLINEIQGSGAIPGSVDDSPLHGETVTVRAVVTMADADLDGYFIQEEPADSDGDPTSSEGLFVYQPSGTLPDAGTTVELTDEVTAHFGLTQFAFPDTAVCDVDPVTIDPTPITLPIDDTGREALESMLVVTAQDLTVSGLFAAYRFGELGLSNPDVLIQPTSVHAPDDPAAMALHEANAANFLKVNDRNEASSQYNPFPWELFDEDLSAGDTMVAGSVIGPLTYSFDEYKIEPLNDRYFPESVDTDPRAEVPALADGNDIAAFNVLNYFNTFGDSDVLRGARNQTQFDLQTAKIVDAVTQMDAAVLGLIEIENDYEDHYDDDPTTVPSVQTLVDALNAAAGEGTYDWVVPDEDILTTEGLGGGGLGTDAIAQALIFQPAKAQPVGPAQTFDIDAELTGDAANSRWPLAQTFRIDGEFVTVVVNHLKSKGSTCTDTAGPGFGLDDDVETVLTGNCNLTRTYAAERLVDWAANDLTFPTDDVLLIGDFNSYEEEDPIEVLVDARYTDLVQTLGDDAFTYKFDGRYGRLDYAFASPSLAAKVTDTEVWPINSRAPVGYLYYNDPIDSSAHASSDHDPVIVSLTDGGRPGNGKGHGHGKGSGDRRGHRF